MNVKLLYAALLAAIAGLTSCSQEKKSIPMDVKSPDGRITFQLSRDEKAGTLAYGVALAGEKPLSVIETSPLGLSDASGDLLAGVEVLSADSAKISDDFTLVSGKRLKNSYVANEIRYRLGNGETEKVTLVVRVSDDGVAFRYELPAMENRIIQGESTGFRLPADAKIWMQPYDSVTRYSPGYEKYFVNGVAAGTASSTENGWCFPALFNAGNAWVLLTEANLNGSYFGSHLQNAEGTLYKLTGPVKAEAMGIGETTAKASGEWKSPWRVIIVGDALASVVESNLVSALADNPADGRNFSWVKPGHASWSWWSEQDSPRKFEALKRFVDLAAAMGWEYSLVDANWNEMKGGTMESLVEYANKKGVGIWLWYNSGGPHNDVTEQPRDIMNDPDRRSQEMKRLQDLGVKGIKVDFFQSDKQHIIQQYLDILADAADHQIMVNFHGCTVPRGWSRTWPNLLSMESARGAESYIFASEFPASAPLHNVQLAFTRNVVGPMDYTPVTFTDNRYPHITTNAHELALAYAFESGMFHAADRVNAYFSLEPKVKELLQTLPVVWDETRLIEGHPSSHIVIARRSGDTWYVAGLNGTSSSREVVLKLPFESSEREAMLVTEGADARKLSVSTPDLSAETKVTMQPNGGFVLRIR